jgi:hypothetical protein
LLFVCNNIFTYLIMRYIILKKEEIEVLEHLHQNSPNNTVRKRSQCLVL